jgi:glycine cleavage system H lipoate-binding protein
MKNWLFKVKLNAPSDLDDLMDEDQYKAMID